VPKHYPIIIPEINNKHSVCDYLIQTASILSQKSYPTYIFYINEPPKLALQFHQISPLLYTFSPIKIIPFNRFKFVQQLNIYLSFNFLFLFCFFRYLSRPKYWIFYPQITSLLRFSPTPGALIYDIVDFFTLSDKKNNQRLQNQKKYLLKKANFVTSISSSLKSSYQKLLPSVKIHLVPQGFKLINSPLRLHPQVSLIKKLTNKIGFIGVISNRLDFKLLFKLIKLTPQVNYIFVGPVSFDINVSPKPIEKLSKKLFSFKNVTHIELVPKNKIAQFINLFDITIIPYDIKDDFNRLSYPMKLFEYFAMGKPVISTPIEELKQFPNLVFIGDTPKSWQQHIDQILSRPWPKNLQFQQKVLARKNSWHNKIKQSIKLAKKSKAL
jgi:glycosyltransferase involved in cell wall biosynthesis